MTDNNSTASPNTDAKKAPFPVTRLLYSIGFAFIAWFVLWIALFLAVVQWIVTAIGGDQNDELKQWSRNVNQYLWEVLSYVVFVRDERPFPFGSPFPRM